MSIFIYKRETFIYEKENSIQIDLCNDIIEIYENDNIKELYDIDNNNDFSKLKKTLQKELIINIYSYYKQINKIENYTFFNLNSFLDIKKKYTFFIENSKTDKNDIQILNRIINNEYKNFMYIWFLNDYNGEIVFYDEYIIKPKAGKFIFFPVSWYFPYNELIQLNSNKYIIYGYI